MLTSSLLCNCYRNTASITAHCFNHDHTYAATQTLHRQGRLLNYLLTVLFAIQNFIGTYLPPFLLQAASGDEEEGQSKSDSKSGSSLAGKPTKPSFASAELKAVYIDGLIENLWALHPRAKVHNMELIKTGHLIVQDKASCMSAAALAPSVGWSVIDGCAAPGSKTSHLAALLHASAAPLASADVRHPQSFASQLSAFDRDASRAIQLKKRMKQVGAKVTVLNQDFTRTDPHAAAWRGVRALLLDPSCSGSGLVETNIDKLLARHLHGKHLHDPASDANAARPLARFQIDIVKHGLRFPRAERVVYSTCSVHQVENEDVVKEVLAACPDWDLLPALPDWPRRGLPVFPGAEKCVRCSPEEDLTHGFFVALFGRKTARGEKVSDKASKSPRVRTASASNLAGENTFTSSTNITNTCATSMQTCKTMEPAQKKSKKFATVVNFAQEVKITTNDLSLPGEISTVAKCATPSPTHGSASAGLNAAKTARVNATGREGKKKSSKQDRGRSTLPKRKRLRDDKPKDA